MINLNNNMQPTIPVVTPEQQKANYAAQNDTTTSPVKVGGSVADTTITSSSMAPTTPVPLATPTNKAADYSSSIAQVATDLASQSAIAQKQADSLLQQGKSTSNEVAAMQALLGGKASDTATTYEVQGVNKLYNQLADLNAQATGLANEAKAIPIQVEQQAMGIGATDAGIAPIQAARLRENALKALSLGQQAAIANAQYDKAKNYADQIVNAKYDQLQANINAKLTNLTALKDFELTPAQTKARDLQERRLKAEEAQLEERKANDKAISDMIVNASQFNAPANLLSKAKELQAKGAKSSEVAIALGQYGGDYYKTELLKQQIATEKAQRAKIFADINQKTGVNSAGKPLKVSNAEITDLNEAIRAKNSVESLITQFKQNIADSGTQVLYGKSAGDREALKTNLLLEMKTLAKTGALDQGTIDVLSGTIPGNTFFATEEAQTAALDNLLTTVTNKSDEYVRSYRGTTAEFDPRTARAFVQKPPVTNEFQKALGGGQATVPGTSIINNITDKGEVDFKLPTSTNVKVN